MCKGMRPPAGRHLLSRSNEHDRAGGERPGMRGFRASAVSPSVAAGPVAASALQPAPSRALPAPGQMLAAERKQGPAPCCWIRLQGEACCAGFGAAESSEFAWKQHAADFALDFCIDPTVSNGPASTERAVWRVVGHRAAAQFESCFALTAGRVAKAAIGAASCRGRLSRSPHRRGGRSLCAPCRGLRL
jgi:hypothetical protein